MALRKLFIKTGAAFEKRERTERDAPAVHWTHSGIQNLAAKAAAAAVAVYLKVGTNPTTGYRITTPIVGLRLQKQIQARNQ